MHRVKNKTRLFLEGLEIWRPCIPYSVLNDKNRHCQSDKIRPSDRYLANRKQCSTTGATIRVTGSTRLSSRLESVPETKFEIKALQMRENPVISDRVPFRGD